MKVLFLDMDNTIAENTTCRDIPFEKGLYLNKRPIKIILLGINLYIRPQMDKVVILTQVQGGDIGRQEKKIWLKENKIEYDDIVFIHEGRSKTSVILDYCKEYNIKPSSCLLIDDKKDILQDADLKGIKTMYPQNLLIEMQEYMKL